MFDRFTDRARTTMALARKESQRNELDFIGTTEILVGLLLEGTGVAATVLKHLGLDVDRARTEIGRRLPPPSGLQNTGQLPFTPGAKESPELCMEEAIELGHDYIGTEHLLLGLLRQEETITREVLDDLRIDREEARAEVLRLLGKSPEGPQRIGKPLSPERGPQAPTIQAEIRDLRNLVDVLLTTVEDFGKRLERLENSADKDGE